MGVTGDPTEETDQAETVLNLERDVADAEERVADLQRRVRVAEVEAEAAMRANQFGPIDVAPVLTTLARRQRALHFELTTASGILMGFFGAGVAWMSIYSLLKQ